MRWDGLFEDLEGQLESLESRDRDDEIAQRIEAELAGVGWADRLRGSRGRAIGLQVRGGPAEVRGELVRVGPDWCLVSDDLADYIVLLAAVTAVQGLSETAEMETSRVAGRLGVAHALRALARDRAQCTWILRDGSTMQGVARSVGADFVDLIAGYPDYAATGAAARDRRVVPFSAVSAVRYAR